MAIHPSAVIDPKAELDSSVEVGPFVTIEGPVCIGAGTRVRPQAYISGWTQIGQRCDIHPQAVVGHLPQDFHYQGERTYCRIGDEVVIREGSTVHRGTQPESATVIGDGCVLLAYSHVAHNCQLGRRVKIYNMSLLSGHAEIDDDAIVSGYSLVHQFCRVGRLAYVAGASIINKDLPPFMIGYGENTVVNHNAVGLRRAGLDRQTVQEIRDAYRILYRSGLPFRIAVARLAETVTTQEGRELVEFVSVESKLGYCKASTNHSRRIKEAELPDDDIDHPGQQPLEPRPAPAPLKGLNR